MQIHEAFLFFFFFTVFAGGAAGVAVAQSVETLTGGWPVQVQLRTTIWKWSGS